MKKLFIILCLSLFAIGLTASGSASESCSVNLRSISEDEELSIGDYVVRSVPCPACNTYGWVVVAKVGTTYKYECVNCGYKD